MFHRSFVPVIRFVFFVVCALFATHLVASSSPSSSTKESTRSVARRAAQTSSPPAPRDVLGFTPGDRRTIAGWRQIRDYFRILDTASPRVSVERLGATTLGRDLVVAYISSEENIRDLQKYKEINRRLADPRTVRTDAEREGLIRDGRTIVAISCSIHSTEIVASQMSMQLAYNLAAARDEETRRTLADTILLLIPSANPDGVDIVADWYRKTLGTKHEGTEPPELYHHYAGHDNNRDWYMMNLAETKHISRLFWREWFPQIVYDVHQQGATGSRFFIPPFHDPANPLIPPALLRETGAIGYRVAADLQAANHKGVITNAIYDMWWHGGFRTAPYYHNAIGILSEAASARLMTPVNVTREQLNRASSRGMISASAPAINFPEPWQGGEWSPENIRDLELTAARTILDTAARGRAKYLRDFYEHGRRAVTAERTPDEPLAYLIPAGQARDEAVAKLVTLLTEQGVEVHRLDREMHADLAGETTREREVPAGSYIVFLNQPYRQNVRALFETQTYPTRTGADGAAERPYDVTGWTLPMQMNVEARAVAAIDEPANERRLTLVRTEADVRRDLGLPLAARAASSPLLRSPVVNPIRDPSRVGLYRGSLPSMDEGWTRYVFDSQNVPYKTLADSDMKREEFLRANFDTIILPSQRMKQIVEGNSAEDYPAQYAGGIGAEGVKSLRSFVEQGGTLVCFDQSAEFAIREFGLPVKNRLAELKPTQFYCPGSILRLDVNTSHPLARGLRRETDAYFINSSAFDVTDETRVRIVARYAPNDTLRSGYLLGAEHISNKPALVEAAVGGGRVILFGFRPQHRAQTWGTYPFIFNALEKRTGR